MINMRLLKDIMETQIKLLQNFDAFSNELLFARKL